jgi:hypothetical protein
MKKLAMCSAIAAVLLPAAPAVAKKKPMRPCHSVGLATMISDIAKRGVSCQDARVVVRSVESHSAQCRPYKQETIAPFRECTVTPALSVGTRSFTCRSAWEVPGEQKRFWKTTCRSGLGDVVRYRRDGNTTP